MEKQQAEFLLVQQQLLEKVNSTSKNSSSPPSSDPPGLEKKSEKQKSSKKRGGQPGHKGHRRDLYPIEECSEIIDHHPEECANCGAKQRLILGIALVNNSWFYLVELMSPTLTPTLTISNRFSLVGEKILIG
ncbi:MAG: DUF1392 family protein [Nostoc sp.]|uniref:DUF1392 family protein n=1 Tax=Nostoc sp. TaxID=1180 RepID=UPI002FFBB447